MKNKLLLCPVDYFNVIYRINPWMHPEIPVAGKRAKKQWYELVSLYSQLNYSLSFIEPANSLPDMVFTANGFFNVGKKAVVARFRFQERQGETELYAKWLRDNGFEVVDPGKIVYEGQGDTLMVGDNIFQGWGFRSDKEVTGLMKKTYPEKNVVPLHLIDDRFYHLDTCFFPVNEELAYYFDGAFDDVTLKKIKKTFKKPVAVTEEEAVSFALNSMTTDHTIVTNSKAKKFKKRVKSEGFRVVSLEMDEFLKSGGSVKCLTNIVYGTN